MPENVADLGEFGLIASVTARLPQGENVVLGPGDDAAVVAAPDGRVVVATDMLVERRHFRRDWSPAYDIGRKAAAQNMADIVAVGARPTALLLGLGAPPDLPAEWVLQVADGMRDEGGRLGASVVGGDTVWSDAVVLAVTALGDLGGRNPVSRGGARPGDIVAVCGRLGWAAAGLRVLSRGFRTPRVLVDAYRRPEVPYEAADTAVELGVTAMCDVSDGLLADLGHIAQASGVAIDVHPEALPPDPPVAEIAALLAEDAERWVLTGGEDHALAATFAPDVTLPEPWRVVGKVSTGAGVTVRGEPYPGAEGYRHFG